MRLTALAGLSAAAIVPAACASSPANDSANNAANVVAEEGIPDPNLAVSGDELAINRQAADDLAPTADGVPMTNNVAR